MSVWCIVALNSDARLNEEYHWRVRKDSSLRYNFVLAPSLIFPVLNPRDRFRSLRASPAHIGLWLLSSGWIQACIQWVYGDEALREMISSRLTPFKCLLDPHHKPSLTAEASLKQQPRRTKECSTRHTYDDTKILCRSLQRLQTSS